MRFCCCLLLGGWLLLPIGLWGQEGDSLWLCHQRRDRKVVLPPGSYLLVEVEGQEELRGGGDQ